MGALHDGHLAHLRLARRHAGATGSVVVSIFVNPLQFGPKEDYTRYPRPLKCDAQLCRDSGATLLFHPSAAQMYHPDHSVEVNETLVSSSLCGRSRPGHFRGVCTVVAKLFHLIGPDASTFGLKDYQQFAVIQRMVRDLNFQIKLLPVETVREPDGLALSSRNQYLTPPERHQAPVIRAALLSAAKAANAGETRAAQLRKLIEQQITAASLARVDYIETVDRKSLQPVTRINRDSMAATAVYFGKTRLIDNIRLTAPHSPK
jgi:pantoate--beta-alanine ligase